MAQPPLNGLLAQFYAMLRTAASTVADPAALTAATLTDSSGGTPNTTLAAVTVPGVLTDNGGGAAANGTIEAITLTEPANLAAQAVINGQLADAIKELSTKANLANTALGVLKDSDADLAAQVNALLVDVTAIRTQLIALITALETAGIVST